MKQSEFENLVKSTYPNMASEIDGRIMVIPITDNLMRIIEIGLNTLKKEIEN